MNAFVHCKCTLWVGYSINYFYFTASVTNKAMAAADYMWQREREQTIILISFLFHNESFITT